MDQIKYQGYARDRGFNPIQMSTASIDSIAQQGNYLLRQMQDNRETNRRNRDAYQSGMVNAQNIERQNRADNFAFDQRSRERYQDAVNQNLQQKVYDAQNYQQNLDKQVTALSVLAPLSGTIGKMIVDWKKNKDEEEQMQAYVDTLINGPDPQEEVKVQAGLAQMRQADEAIQTTADQLEDAGAVPEAVRSVRKLSKNQQVGRAKAMAALSAQGYGGWLTEQYNEDDQTQIQFLDPTTGQVKLITPANHEGPDQREAVNRALFKKFVKMNGLLGVNPALVADSLLAMRRSESALLEQERTAFIKAENENKRTDLSIQFDAAIGSDPITAFNDFITQFSHLKDDNGARLGKGGARDALIARLVERRDTASLNSIADSESYVKGKTWRDLFPMKFQKALNDIQSSQAAEEDLSDRLVSQERENWSDQVIRELVASPEGVSEEVVDKAINASKQLYNGWVDQRLLSYRENSTLQARQADEQNKILEQLYEDDELTVQELESGKYSKLIADKWRSKALDSENRKAQSLKPYRDQVKGAIVDELLKASDIAGYGTRKSPTYHFAEAHAMAQLDAQARTYMLDGKSANEAYSLAAQNIRAQIEKDNVKDGKPRYGTYTFRDGEFARWGSRGSGGQGSLSAARANVSSVINQVSSGGQAAVYGRTLITKQQAESLVDPNAPIPDIINVIANSLPKGKEMSVFAIIDAQLNKHGLPPRQRPYVQQMVESTMSPKLQELLNRTPTALRTSRALVGSQIVGPGQERQAIGYIAQKLGVDPVDVATFINYETGGSLVSGRYSRGLDVWGGDGNNYFGWIQFSPANREKYGVKPGMNSMQMADAVVRYLKDSGIRPGDGLEMMYQAVQAPALLKEARAAGRNIGRDSNAAISEHIRRMRAEHRNVAGRWLMEGAQSGGTSSVWRDPRLLSAPAKRLLTQHQLTSSFGNQESFRKKPHEGNDYYVPVGGKLSFKQPGVVLQVGSPNEYNGGYGGFIDVRLQDGNVVRMAHLSNVKVKPGQRIGAKQIAALSGNTGRSTGPHVHIEHLSGPSGTQETLKGKRNPSWIASQVYADI
jgi:hypothetical protein